jgi:predicted Zn-dependent protease
VDALHCIHEVIVEEPQNAAAWRFGGQVALSQPEFLEFACDWTGEAVKAHPNDQVLLAQRGEALMLSQQTSEACDFWKRACAVEPQPRSVAALILCELIAG